MPWRYALLEIYSLDKQSQMEDDAPFPRDGTPADWIDEHKVAWCDGEIEWFVAELPWRKLLWWKISYSFTDWWESVKASIWVRFHPHFNKEFEASMLAEVPMTAEEIQEIQNELKEAFHVEKHNPSTQIEPGPSGADPAATEAQVQDGDSRQPDTDLPRGDDGSARLS